MAGLNMAMYDYDGAMFAFGVVSGLYNVAAVRMYVSTGMGTTYQYYSTDIYSQYEGLLNTVQSPSPCFAFYVRTDRHAENGSPTQLDYWLRDENDDGYGRYKFSFHFYDASGRLLNTTPYRPSIGGSNNVYYQMHNSLNSPSVSYDAAQKKLRVSASGGSNTRLMVEIVRKDRNKVNAAYSKEVKDYAYTVLMKDLEGGKYWEPVPDTSMMFIDWDTPDTKALSRYFTGRHGARVLILFDAGAAWGSEKQVCIDHAKEALSDIAGLTGIHFTDFDVLESDKYYKADCYGTADLQNATWGANSGLSWDQQYQMIIRFGKSSTMDAADFGGEGRWFSMMYSGDKWASEGVTSCHAMIQVEASETYESLNHVIHEEIQQSLGIGGDNYEYLNSIHADPEYCNPESYTGIDADILRFIYGSCQCGWDSFDFINNVDTPCILFADCDGSGSYEFDISKLNGDTYYVSAWVAQEKSNPGEIGTSSIVDGGGSEFQYWHGGWDDSPYSLKTTIEINHNGLTKWDWNASNGLATAAQTQKAYAAVTGHGRLLDFSYLVWNDLVNKINDAAVAAGSSWSTMYETYDATKMSASDKVLTAKRFNAARQNVGSRVSTGINEVSRGDTIYGHYFTTLTDRLNEWIAKL